jgi:hypothetical protein
MTVLGRFNYRTLYSRKVDNDSINEGELYKIAIMLTEDIKLPCPRATSVA